MKQMMCEMCGSTDLIKTEGVFVCQSCGCKYTPEEAKKMMVEIAGTVDVSGSTVKVDTNERLANLYEIARRSRDNNDNETAARYYEMILIDDPQSWEAAFYSVYCKALECRIIQIKSAADTVNQSLGSVFKLIKSHCSETEQMNVLKEIEAKCVTAAWTFYISAKNNYINVPLSLKADSTEYTHEYFERAFASRDLLLHCGDKIESVFDKESFTKGISVDAWKEGVKINEDLLNYLSSQRTNVTNLKDTIIKYQNKIKKRDSSYQDSEARKKRQEEKRREINSLDNQIGLINKEITALATGEKKGEEKVGLYIGLGFLLLILMFFYDTTVLPDEGFTFLNILLHLIWVPWCIGLFCVGISNAKKNSKSKARTKEEIEEESNRRKKDAEQLKQQKAELITRKKRAEKELSEI